MRSVRAYLLALMVGLVLVASAAFAYLIHDAARTAREVSKAQLQETANILSTAVDGELKGALGILTALATSRAVQGGDWDIVDRQARAALAGRDSWLVVQDSSGRQIVNTRLERGAALPSGPAPQAMWQELATGKPRICNLVSGQVEPNIVCVDMPVAGADGRQFAMSIVLQPSFFESIVTRHQVQEGHVAALIDRSGRLIWRNIQPEKFVGTSATPDVREAIGRSEQAMLESRTLDGTAVVAAFKRSRLSGWTVIVGTPTEVAGAGAPHTQRRAAFIALGILAIGCALALFIASRLSRALRKLGATAARGDLSRGKPPPSTGFTELDELQNAFRDAASAQAMSDDRFHRIFQQTSDLILTANLDRVITDLNPSAAMAIGVSRDQAIGRAIADFLSPEDYERTSEMLRQKMEHGGTTRYDVRVRSQSGKWLDWEINTGLTYDEEGRPMGIHIVGRDVTDRRRWEEHQKLLVAELNHRVKNTLAIVQSLAQQTFHGRGEPADMVKAFEQRLSALAHTHNMLTQENWEAADLRTLIESTLDVHARSADQFSLDGPDLRIPPQTAVTIALAFHELATNAVKYGALSVAEGHVGVTWSVADSRLLLRWTETGGPAVVPPARRGFGSRMIERALPRELGGKVELSYAPSGVTCTIDAPFSEHKAQ